MKYFLFFWLVLFFLQKTSCFGQKSNEYIGAIKLMDSSIITYKIKFELISDNQIKGYSITDFGGDHETKSSLTGYYDKGKQTYII